ncbi:MAG: PAS domain-containing protein [Chloroflexi bacterium]|nr:PAS domain-containing protein [Chloroflexota bacterium]
MTARQSHTRRPVTGGTAMHGGDVPVDVDTQVLIDVFSNMQVGLAVWRLEDIHDENTFRLIASNPAARQVGRMPPGYFIGATLAEALPGAIRTGLVAVLAEVVRSGEATDLGVVRYGDEHIPEADYRVRAFPVADDCVGTMFEVVDAEQPSGEARPETDFGLTKRETTVLYYVAAGRADKEIAKALGISPETVHKHVSSILRKMRASSRTEASVVAIKSGLLGP